MTSDPRAKKGRGAIYNPHNRFQQVHSEVFDDGWYRDEDAPTLQTTVTEDRAKSIVAHNQSPDVPFESSINPYKGCEHGCVYCYARPSHAYWGLSPGQDFETKLFAKRKGPELLRAYFNRASYKPQVIALGANTDPYQPIERQERITRELLGVMLTYQHPVMITTKSANVVRDLDLLVELAKLNLVSVGISVTTLDGQTARSMEPRASAPFRRLDAIQRLAQVGVPVGVMVAPIIPGLTDWELERIVTQAAQRGAQFAAPIMIRLPLEVKPLFEAWLEHWVPDRKKHVLSLISQVRSGPLNTSEFHERMKGTGSYADLIHQRMNLICQKLGLNKKRMELSCDHFRRPDQNTSQLELFT
ncbi:MAG: PA0069 family radical SAM protein [Acidobacteria bacterium]|nr:PA0069 family radical SAM protein [Acidobacteriota bacterium]